MDFQYSKEQKMYQDSASNFFKKEWSFDMLREVMDDKGFAKDHWVKIADLGWQGMLIEEKYGGIGASFMDLCPIIEEMGRVLYPGPFIATAVMGTFMISNGACEKVKKKILSEIADGDTIVTMALGEMESRYPEKTDLTAGKKGNDYIISGTALFVPYADSADYIICRAKDDSKEKETIFLVDAKSEGIKMDLLPTFSIERYNKVVFEKVSVPKENVLGNPNDGGNLIEKFLPIFIASRCMEMIGGMQKILDMTVLYVNNRKQFGKPLGSFQAISHLCAEMAIDVDASRFITYQAAWRVSEHLACRKEVSMAKAWSADAYQRVTASALQAHGAIGFTDEFNIHFYYKQAKSLQLMFGGADFHKKIVANEMGY